VEAAVSEAPIAFIVFRTILGFTPPEWAYITTEDTGVAVDQGAARLIDRNMRMRPLTPRPLGSTLTDRRIRAMIEAGIQILLAGRKTDVPTLLHRLDKADTKEGIKSVEAVADLGVPYPVLLYERFLGRPFASHRDSVSELVGEVVEAAIEGCSDRCQGQFPGNEAGGEDHWLRPSAGFHYSRRVQPSGAD
jgi:hypothetical protein